MPDIFAETERLVLRRERPGDIEIWLEHMNTPAVAEKVGGVQPPEKVAEAFAKMAEATEAGGPSFLLVALKADGALIGKCGLAPIETAVAPDELRNAIQVGWTLRADHWGQGYAREAAEAALSLAFERFGLPRVYAQTSQRNTASWGLMERLGMERRADLDYPDADYPPEDNPTMVYSLDAVSWRERSMAEFRLETERLVLRDWRDEDWPEFFRVTNTPAVMRWLGGVADNDAQAKARARLEARGTTLGFNLWALERKRDGGHLSGDLLGFCGLKLSDEEGGPIGEFEIGWRLREDAWGRGYAREAAQASLRVAFERFGARQVIALTIEENAASWGLMHRLGMRRREDLDFHSTALVAEGEDVIVYSISRNEWAAA